jgi:hypothetical protein
MTGTGPLFWVENPYFHRIPEPRNQAIGDDEAASARIPQVYYFSSVALSDLDWYRQQGYHCYYIRDVKPYLETFLRYDLDSAGVLPLDVPIPH